jgi:hypothetical protein
MQAERFSGSSQENIVFRPFESPESGFGQLTTMSIGLCAETIKMTFPQGWDWLRHCLGSQRFETPNRTPRAPSR